MLYVLRHKPNPGRGIRLCSFGNEEIVKSETCPPRTRRRGQMSIQKPTAAPASKEINPLPATGEMIQWFGKPYLPGYRRKVLVELLKTALIMIGVMGFVVLFGMAVLQEVNTSLLAQFMSLMMMLMIVMEFRKYLRIRHTHYLLTNQNMYILCSKGIKTIVPLSVIREKKLDTRWPETISGTGTIRLFTGVMYKKEDGYEKVYTQLYCLQDAGYVFNMLG